MKAILLSVCFICFVIVGVGIAMSPPSKCMHVVSEWDSDYIFIMGSETKEGSFGVCYRIEDDLSLTKNWTVKGFYASAGSVRLSRDGRWLARAVALSRSRTDSESTAIEIYKDGVLKSKLPIKLFVDDSKHLEHSQVDSNELIFFNYQSERYLDLVDGYGMTVQLVEDGVEQQRIRKADEYPEGVFLRVDFRAHGLFRCYIDVESGKVVHKYKTYKDGAEG